MTDYSNLIGTVVVIYCGGAAFGPVTLTAIDEARFYFDNGTEVYRKGTVLRRF